jgi:hypothetical protein
VSELHILVPGGGSLSLDQAVQLARRIRELGSDHWHLNDCGCCVTVHGTDCAYVIDRDGGETFFAERGCSCDLP